MFLFFLFTTRDYNFKSLRRQPERRRGCTKKRPIPKKSDAFHMQHHTLEASDYSKIGPFLHNLGDPTGH
jgi:hypothetical protein